MHNLIISRFFAFSVFLGLILSGGVRAQAFEHWYAGEVTVVNQTTNTLQNVTLIIRNANGRDSTSVRVNPMELAPNASGMASGFQTGDSSQIPGGQAPNGYYGVQLFADATVVGDNSPHIQTANMLPIANETESVQGTLTFTDNPVASSTGGIVKDVTDGVSQKNQKSKPPCGMPRWEVSEPYISLWLKDEPLGYQPSLGPRVSFELSYKQREDVSGFNTNTFSVGKGWNFSWYSHIYTNQATAAWNRYPNGGLGRQLVGQYDRITRAVLTGEATSGFLLKHPDGSSDYYGLIVSSNATKINYLTERRDPLGHATTLYYDPVNPSTRVVRLRYVVDGDGRTNTISYVTNHPYSTNLISQVTDPFGRTTTLQYDDTGHLTNITDVAGLPTSFKYSGDTVIEMTTPYGTNQFAITEATSPSASTSGRSILITEPDGSHQLYLFKDSAPGVSASYPSYDIPSTAPFLDKFETNNLSVRNTFHWGARQYASLSTNNIAYFTADDYRKARMRHWLRIYNGTEDVDDRIGVEREPSPDLGGSLEGAKTWYGYYDDIYESTLPTIIAEMLPTGTNRFRHFLRNTYGNVKEETSTYSLNGATLLRTNTYIYRPNLFNLYMAIDSRGVPIVSNWYSFTSPEQVIVSANALGEQTLFTYNNKFQLTSIKWPSGLTTTNIYYTSGLYTNWLAKTIDVEIGSSNGFSYTNGLVYTLTNSRGLIVTNEWDALQRLRRVSFPDGTFITNSYQRLDLVSTVDRMGFSNSFGYDGLGRLTKATNALGYITTYDYCTCGALNWIRDAAGNYTHFYRDNLGRATNVVYADNYAVTNMFNSMGQLISSINSDGVSVSRTYNNQGLVTAINNITGLVASVTYDILDRATNIVDANGVVITNTYDDLSRLLTRGYPDGGVEKFVYSANVAAPTTYINQIGNTNIFAYDKAGRLTNEICVGVTTNRFGYNQAGDLLRLIDGRGQTNRWRYDSVGLVTGKTNAAGNEIFRYGYDANNRLTTRWSAAKGTTTYGYDEIGNVTSVDYPVSPDIALQYDSLNRLTNMVDASGTNKYVYNEVSQLLSEDGPWTDDTVSYTYQNRARATMSLSQPSASAWTQTYGYDVAQRLSSITSPAGTFEYDYDTQRQGLITQIDLPGDSYITNAYDSVSRLLSTQLKQSGGMILNSHTYTYNVAGQRTALVNTAGDSRSYTYDNAGQLLTALGVEANGTTKRLNEQLGYVYDAGGSLRFRTNNALVQTFGHNALNQLTNVTRSGTVTVAGNTTTPATNVTVNGATATRYADLTWAATNFALVNASTNFTSIGRNNYGFGDTNVATVSLLANNTFVYDLNGNLRTNNTKIFEYDDENQLIANWVPSAWKSEFVYDGKGRKRIERNFGWTTSGWNKTNEVHYVYDGPLAIQERNDSNNLLTTYTRGLGMAGGIGGLLARTEGSPVTPQLTTTFYHADGGGNITALVNTNGLVVAQYAYDPFGNLLKQNGPVAERNHYRFSSKEYESLSGLYYYGYRFYDPNLQQWINRDPIQEAGGINLYAFVFNSPIGFVDPFGLEYMGHLKVIENQMSTAPKEPYRGHVWEIYDSDEANAAVTAKHEAAREREGAIASTIVGDLPAIVASSVGGPETVAVFIFNEIDKLNEKFGPQNDQGEPCPPPMFMGTIKDNRAAGAAWEAELINNELPKTQKDIRPQITIKSDGPSGMKARLDAVGTEITTDALKLTDGKASATAPLTKNQKVVYPELEVHGGTVVGEGKAPYVGGTKVPPTKVNIRVKP